MTVADDAPDGWQFYTADASMPGSVRVMLKRDREGFNRWLALDDDAASVTPLYVHGRGKAFEEALSDACKKARQAGSV